MTFDDIYRFFNSPPPFYLTREQAVCYVLSILVRRDAYGSEIVHHLESKHPPFRLSDTVLYSALQFLSDHRFVTDYLRRAEGRGRPRRMYELRQRRRPEAEELARLWQHYIDSNYVPLSAKG